MRNVSAGRRKAENAYRPNFSVRPDDSFRKDAWLALGEHLVSRARDEIWIVGVQERQIFRHGWRLCAGLQPVDLKHPRRPVFKAGGSVECPAAPVPKPLALREVKLG